MESKAEHAKVITKQSKAPNILESKNDPNTLGFQIACKQFAENKLKT